MAGKQNDEYLRVAAAAVRAQDGMRPVFDIFQGLRQAMQPFTDLQKKIGGIQAQFRIIQEQNLAVARAIQVQTRFVNAVEKLQLGPVMAAAEKLASHARRAQAFDEAGWLPHYSTPLDRVEEYGDDGDAIHIFLSGYYGEHWPEVRRDIEARLSSYRLDDEAKAAFREALAAHETGLYRCVCRVLMPEIERVTSKELPVEGEKWETSRHALRDLASCLPISSIPPGGFLGLNLFDRLSKHLYRQVKDEETRQRVARDPVPNRHAAVHGLVAYSSVQNSLNAIFMTDYIFQVISLLKEMERSPPTNGKVVKQECGASGLQSEG